MRFPQLVLLCCGAILMGCTSATVPTDQTAAESPASPETLRPLLQQIIQLDQQISQAAKQDELEDAHGALHEIGTALEALEQQLARVSLPAEQKKQSTQAINSLFDSFGAVDAILHGQEGKLYAQVEEEIAQAIRQLQTQLDGQAAQPANQSGENQQ